MQEIKRIDTDIEVHQPSYNAGWQDCLEDFQKREAKLVEALKEVIDAVNNLNDIWDIENIAKSTLQDLGIE